MHLLEIVVGDQVTARAAAPVPFGAGIPRNIAKTAVMLEIWGSSFGNKGQDFTRFILRDAQGKEIMRQDIRGY